MTLDFTQGLLCGLAFAGGPCLIAIALLAARLKWVTADRDALGDELFERRAFHYGNRT